MRNRGFTLVEILVVTSIISLLSSTIYSGTSEIKAKAKVTAVQMADRNRNIALSDSVLSTVTFNSTPGSPSIPDTSGTNNTYSPLGGGNVPLSTDVPVENDNYLGISSTGASSVTNYSATFNDSPLVLNSGSSLIGKLLKSHTISLWAKFEGASIGGALININGLTTNYSMAGIAINYPQELHEEYEFEPQAFDSIWKSIIPIAHATQFPSPPPTPRYTNVGPASLSRGLSNLDLHAPHESSQVIPNYDPGTGVWHHYAYSYDDNTKILTLYIDGNKYSQVDRSGYVEATLGIYSGARTVESVVLGPSPFTGKIDDVAIYESVQPLSVIKAQYMAGREKFSNPVVLK